MLLLHGWPGDRHDYRALVPLLDGFDMVVPDLRGFGESDKHPAEPETGYSAAAQAASVTALLTELGLDGVIVAGYDIGSRIAQTLAAAQPALVRHLVVAPPLPGIGARILDAAAQREFWYQSFHQLALAEELLDGQPGAVRDYLAHFWRHWSGPEFTQDGADLDRLAAAYGAPGAFTGRGRVGGQVAGRAAARGGGPAGRAGHRAVARARPAVPAGLGRPAGRVLHRGHAADDAGRGPLLPAGGPGDVRHGDQGRRGLAPADGLVPAFDLVAGNHSVQNERVGRGELLGRLTGGEHRHRAVRLGVLE